MKNKKTLVICRPFNFINYKFKENIHFCFTTTSHDHLSRFYEGVFEEIYFEESLELSNLPKKAKSIKDFVIRGDSGKAKVLYTPSSDTHCQLFETIQDKSKIDCLYAIPPKYQKDEKALESLNEVGITPIIIPYNQESCTEIEKFNPIMAICANDWCSEYNTINKILKKNKHFMYLAIQEGPQDWHGLINGQLPNKYLNTDFLFSQGPVTINYIQPKFFANTGIPKTDGFSEIDLPKEPQVFINLNFTYDNWEVDRDNWISSCISICKKLKLKYLISQHPRDNGKIDDPNLVSSSAYKVVDQIKDCSISISRFSTIPLETLRVGRHSIYFNPHGETPRSYNEDKTEGIYKAFNAQELEMILKDHLVNYKFNKVKALESLEYHASIQDGNSNNRIVDIITGISSNTINLKSAEGFLN